MINKKYKIIQINIPRTASSHRVRVISELGLNDVSSTEIQKLLFSEIDKHSTSIEWEKKYSNCFNEYYKYTFVRNPWERMVSFYKYRRRKYGEVNFNYYILVNCLIRGKYSDLNKQQLDYIRDHEGNIMVDYIGRFEHLYTDFDEICKKNNIDKKLEFIPSKLNQNYQKYYNSLTKYVVGKKFKDDIQFFNYKF